MKYISGILRIVTGLAVVGMAIFVYTTNKNTLDLGGDQRLVLFGKQINASPNVVMIVICILGLVGFLVAILGLVTMLKKNK
jgi:hypothetical protein